jgi:hypothetical protein
MGLVKVRGWELQLAKVWVLEMGLDEELEWA